jgi:hypothetical protein
MNISPVSISFSYYAHDQPDECNQEIQKQAQDKNVAQLSEQFDPAGFVVKDTICIQQI